MTFYVNNISALRIWSMNASSLEAVSSACDVHTVKDASCSATMLRSMDLSAFGVGKPPLHVLVPRADMRTSSQALACHVHQSPFPRGSFRRLSSDLVVASPELTFLEMARVLPYPKLVEFGFLLTGTYTVNPSASVKNARQPLTTRRKLENYLEKAEGEAGCPAATRALKCVVEGSASPRETKLTMLLCMPTKRGGYGFAAPYLNYKLTFSARERYLFGRSFVVLDLYWPQYRLGIEYDGKDYHSSDQDLQRDRLKSTDLEYKGIRVMRIGKEHLRSPYQLYVLAEKLRRAMGKPSRKPTAQQKGNREQLFNCIMRNRW